MGRRRIIALLLLGQVCLGVIGLALWARLPDAPPTPPLPTAAEPDRPTSIESAWPVAAAAATGWLPEAFLLHATLQIDWPWAEPEPGERERIAETGWVTYVFVAPWRGPGRPPGGASLSVLVERLSGQVAYQDTVAWETLPAATPVALPGESAVPSLRAVRVAEVEVGAAFRHACPVYRHLTRVSLVTTPELPTHWLVTYEDTRQRDRHGLMVRVDAASGEVLATGGTAPAC